MSSNTLFSIDTVQLRGDEVYQRVFNVSEVPSLKAYYDACGEEGDKVYVYVKDLNSGRHWLEGLMKEVGRWCPIRWRRRTATRDSDEHEVEGPVVVCALVSKEEYPTYDFDYDWLVDESKEDFKKFQAMRDRPQEHVEENIANDDDIVDFIRAFMIVNHKTRDTVIYMPMDGCPAVFSEEVKERVEKALETARRRKDTYRDFCAFPDSELYRTPVEYLDHFERYWNHLIGPQPVVSADSVEDM